MLRMFGAGKADHPMANPKEAKRLLGELTAQEPLAALDEIAHWLESVGSVEGFSLEQRIQLLADLDGAAQPHLRKIARDYFAPQRPSRYQETRLWTQAHEYWRQSGHAYARCVDAFLQGAKGAESAKEQLPLVLVRTLRSLAQQIKWMHLRYGPIDLAAWGILNSTYAFAEARGLAEAKAAPLQGAADESSPRREFLHAVVLSASSPDSLQPLGVDLAERLIGDLAPQFALAAAPEPRLLYWTDLGRAMAPLRIAQPPQLTPSLRCIGAGGALERIRELAEKIGRSGQLPSDLNLGASYDPELVVEVLERLAMHWGEAPPERQHKRHSMQAMLVVSHGFEGVLDVLGASTESLDFDAAQGAETWLVENVSAGGICALAPKSSDWLKVGALLAFQPDGASGFQVGMVRRVNRTAGLQARVGIQTLARAPAAATFLVNGRAAQGIVLDGDRAEVRIALRPGVFARGQNIEADHAGRQHVYLPQAVAERGEDYEIARFRELVREA